MKMQESFIIFLGLIHFLYPQSTSSIGGQCCQRKIVSSPLQYEGTYDLIRENGQKEGDCADTCIYSKQESPGEEYCFKSVSSGAASIEEHCGALETGLETGIKT